MTRKKPERKPATGDAAVNDRLVAVLGALYRTEIQLNHLQAVMKDSNMELYIPQYIVEDLKEANTTALHLLAENNDPTVAHALGYDEKDWEKKYEQFRNEFRARGWRLSAA